METLETFAFILTETLTHSSLLGSGFIPVIYTLFVIQLMGIYIRSALSFLLSLSLLFLIYLIVLLLLFLFIYLFLALVVG